MFKRDNAGRRQGSKHSVLNGLRRNPAGYALDDTQRTAPPRFGDGVLDAASVVEDDYQRLARRGE